MTPEGALVRQPPSTPERYEPDQGVKTIALAEVAERYFRRAKDATRLLEAVELKLAEQRKFVLWWDGQAKNPGHRFGTAVTDLKPPSLDTLGLDKVTVHRWRVKLADDGRYALTLQQAQQRCLQACEVARGGLPDHARTIGTGFFEWYTPAEYVEAARDVLGTIDLDPASSDLAQRTVRAARYFTIADDGLRPPWPGRVWLNPPYAQPAIAHFVRKLLEEYTAGRTTAAVLLTHAYSDNGWFQMAARGAAAVCFTRGRIAFERADGFTAAPTQGQAFFYYGPDRDGFRHRFRDIGVVMRPDLEPIAGLETD